MTGSTAERMRWMDLVRGICIILVILVHSSAAIMEVGIELSGWIKQFNDFFWPYRMQTLMFLSGMLLSRSLDKPVDKYVWGKLALIFWPYVIWSLVILLAEGRFTLSNLAKIPIVSPTLLWYLWFIFAYYLMALVVHRLRMPLVPVILVALVASAFLPEIARLFRFSFLFAFFLMGHLAVSQNLAAKIPWPLALVGLVFAVAGGVASVMGHRINYDPVYAICPIGLLAFVLRASAYYQSSRGGAFIEWVGRNSIVFYVAHFPAQLVLAMIFAPLLPIPADVFYLFIVITSFAVVALLQLARARFTAAGVLFDLRLIMSMPPALSRMLNAPWLQTVLRSRP